ncbi:MAG: hypothetical protein RIE52_09940 [Balneola sp.]
MFNKNYSDDLFKEVWSPTVNPFIVSHLKENILQKNQIPKSQLEKTCRQPSNEFDKNLEDIFSIVLDPNNNDWANLNSVINYSITYLEKYCDYDKILMDIRFYFEGYTYNEFQDLKPTKLRTRLIELIKNNIESLSGGTILVGIDDFDEFKPKIDHQSIFNSIKESVPDIIRKIKSAKDSSYFTLLIESKPFNNQSEYTDNSFDRIKHNYSHIIEDGISIESLTVEGGNSSDFIVIDEEETDKYGTPAMPQKVGLFNLEESIDRFHHIIEGLIKLSVLNELEIAFKTNSRYKPPFFIVKGPTDAIDKYSSWFINKYNLKRPIELAKKLEEYCYQENKNGKSTRLKRSSIERIIRKSRIF